MLQTHIYLLHVLVTHVAILREVRYKEWIHRDTTEVCVQMHRHKILNFTNIWFKILTKNLHYR